MGKKKFIVCCIIVFSLFFTSCKYQKSDGVLDVENGELNGTFYFIISYFNNFQDAEIQKNSLVICMDGKEYDVGKCLYDVNTEELNPGWYDEIEKACSRDEIRIVDEETLSSIFRFCSNWEETELYSYIVEADYGDPLIERYLHFVWVDRGGISQSLLLCKYSQDTKYIYDKKVVDVINSLAEKRYFYLNNKKIEWDETK